MNRRHLLRASALGLVVVPPVATSTGCAALWEFLNQFIDAPRLAIRKMDITKMTMSSMKVKFFADIVNPNPFGFKLFGLDYLLKASGNQLAKGTAPQGIDLRPGGRAKTEFDLDFNLGRTAEAVLELVTKKVVPYELEAVGKFLSKEGGVDVPVGFAGRLPMPKLPPISVRSFEPRGISASGVDFRVVTAVKNENDFELPIDGFAFDVKIKPGKTDDVAVDFKVGLPALGVSLAEAMSGKTMRYELGGLLVSDLLRMPLKEAGSFRLT
jgi:LEA14-like dessication related protein